VSDLAAALERALEIGEANAGIELLRAMRASDFSQIAPETLDLVARTLRSAVNSPDPRIRFLACDAALNAAHTDISSTAVLRTFKSIREGSQKPEAVVVDSNDQSLRNLDVALEDTGFAVVPCQTGQDGFDAAAGQMNCELILIDAESAGWPLATTLANLRSDVRTRNVPIVVLGPARFAARVSRLANIHPGVWFLTEPVGVETLVPNLNSLLPPHLLSPDDRTVMKAHPGVSSK
jgi:CheY-like chemotaxis protein